MKKGNARKQKKFLSIVLIPHSSDNVKVLRFSAFYSKLTAVSALMLSLLVCLAFFIVYTVNQNQILKSTVTQLKNENIKQSELISEKSTEISKLKEQENTINSKMNDFMEKYREIANTLLNRSTDVRSSRSTESNTRSYIKELNELKVLLNDLNTASTTQSMQLSTLDDTEKKLEKYIESLPTIKPTEGRISSPFGGRRDPFHNRKRFHEGMDFAASWGTNIKAAAAGKVVFSGYTSGYGYNVILDHGNSLSTLYGHCSSLVAKEGQTVKKGQVIAKVGSSGRSTGAHLHYEVRIDGEQVDPSKYFSE